MKRMLMYIVVGLVVVFVGLQAWTTMSTKGTPQQPYTVLATSGDVEIRHYPEALSAFVVRSGGAYRDVANTGFRSLAGYIFGGNAEGRQIAMTAPVHMEMGADSSRMRFIMPEGLTMDSLPTPNDPGVKLERMPAETVAVLQFGGFANDEAIAKHAQELLEQVKAAGVEPLGAVRFLGYDPPWQLAGRRNEVIVAVKWPR
jgi:hypothetical protein